MSDPLPDVWTHRDYPVLRDATRRIDAGEEFPSSEAIAEALAMPHATVRLALRALERNGYITASEDGEEVVIVHDVARSAYLLTGLHPDADNALDALIQTLEQAASRTRDATERSKLKQVVASLLDLSRDVAGGVLTAYLSAQLPR